MYTQYCVNRIKYPIFLQDQKVRFDMLPLELGLNICDLLWKTICQCIRWPLRCNYHFLCCRRKVLLGRDNLYIYMSKEFHVSKALWYRNISTSSTTKTKFEKTLPLGQPGTERPKTIAVCTMTKIAATIHLCQTDSKSAMCRFQSFWKSIK